MPSYTEPQWSRSALVLIDVQNDFVEPNGAMPVPGTAELLPQLTALADAFRSTHRPVAHVVRLYVPHGSDTDLARRASIEAGTQIVAPHTPGSQIPQPLLPRRTALDSALLLSHAPQIVGARERIYYKPRWSAFYRTSLDDWLRACEVTTVVVAGCNLPNCPRATLFDASNRDYRAVLAADATSQSTPERLADLALIGTEVWTTDAIVTAIAQAA
ncbi:cysteine hydrolase family protein [Cumulibacter soli]|uniref:cysteine hydrolase family protein n=1 Tax=Cumulibacter soli TaxID=2546344 RepID=UPI00106895C7|nr:isochorismatase family cysteine hydrolase [Cumulibacter soli]